MQPGSCGAMLLCGVGRLNVALRRDGESDLAAGGNFDVVLFGDEDAGVLAADAAVKVDTVRDSGLIDAENLVAP